MIFRHNNSIRKKSKKEYWIREHKHATLAREEEKKQEKKEQRQRRVEKNSQGLSGGGFGLAYAAGFKIPTNGMHRYVPAKSMP